MKAPILQTILLVPVILSLFSCSQDTKFSQDNESYLTIDVSNFEEHIVDTSIVAEVKIIPLVANEPIGVINKLIVSNDLIYIMDRTYSKSILVFDLDGKFKYQISSFGAGPGEYNSIWDFDVIDGKIFLLDLNQRKILVYEEGKHLRSIKLDSYITSFSCIDEKRLVLSRFTITKDNNYDQNNILFYEANNNVTNVQFKQNDCNPVEYPNTGSVFYKSRQGIMMSYPYNDTIYKYSDTHTKFKPYIYFNFGDQKSLAGQTCDIKKKLAKDDHFDLMMESNIFLGIDNIYESESHISCQTLKQMDMFCIAYSKRSNKFLISTTYDLFFSICNTVGVYEDYFVSIIDPESVSSLKETWEVPDNTYKTSNYAEKLKFLDHYGEDGMLNPIIVLYKLKEF